MFAVLVVAAGITGTNYELLREKFFIFQHFKWDCLSEMGRILIFLHL